MDLARKIIGLGRFKVRRVCGLLKVSRSNQYQNRKQRPKRYKRKDDGDVLKSVLEVIKTRGTYGYPRVTARINRDRKKMFLKSWNEKRVLRIMQINNLTLPKSIIRKERLHNGKVITLKSNLRWCSDILEIQCWNGEEVHIAFSLDCHDREIMGYVIQKRDMFHEDIIELIDRTVTKRFGDFVEKVPNEIQWLSDQGPQYTARNTKQYARDWGLLPVTTPSYSPESNGAAESFVKTFKRDYVYPNDLWTAESVIRQVPLWFDDYNQNHPHSGLKMMSPLEYREKQNENLNLSV